MTLSGKYYIRTGVDVIDYEHDVILEEINSIIDHRCVAMYDPFGALSRIAIKVRAHFITEERLMKMYLYPETSAHVSRHDVFLRELRYLIERLSNGGGLDVNERSRYLSRWMIGHIAMHDCPLGDYIRTHNADIIT